MSDRSSAWERKLIVAIAGLLAVPADQETVRVAMLTDGARSLQGLADTMSGLRERGISSLEIDLIEASDRFDLAEALTARHYDLVHVCSPDPAGAAALVVARVLGVPTVGNYAGGRSAAVTAAFYRQCRLVLSPSPRADVSLVGLGIEADRIVRWAPGVDLKRFNPGRYDPAALGSGEWILQTGSFTVLYAGALRREQGTDLLAEAFLIARDQDPRLHLVLAGRGPEEQPLRSALGNAATFLGRVPADALARVYASADLFIVPSGSDTFGQAILEAQASGLPVLAVDVGAPAELIQSGRSGCLAPPDPAALAGALRGLARRAAIRDRLATGGLFAARERTWERSLALLARAYERALGYELGDQLTQATEVAEVSRAA